MTAFFVPGSDGSSRVLHDFRAAFLPTDQYISRPSAFLHTINVEY